MGFEWAQIPSRTRIFFRVDVISPFNTHFGGWFVSSLVITPTNPEKNQEGLETVNQTQDHKIRVIMT